MGGQLGVDLVPNFGKDARGFGVLVRVKPGKVRKALPLRGIERGRRVAPVVATELAGHLQDYEPVGPGGDAALAAELGDG